MQTEGYESYSKRSDVETKELASAPSRLSRRETPDAGGSAEVGDRRRRATEAVVRDRSKAARPTQRTSSDILSQGVRAADQLVPRFLRLLHVSQSARRGRSQDHDVG